MTSTYIMNTVRPGAKAGMSVQLCLPLVVNSDDNNNNNNTHLSRRTSLFICVLYFTLAVCGKKKNISTDFEAYKSLSVWGGQWWTCKELSASYLHLNANLFEEVSAPQRANWLLANATAKAKARLYCRWTLEQSCNTVCRCINQQYIEIVEVLNLLLGCFSWGTFWLKEKGGSERCCRF